MDQNALIGLGLADAQEYADNFGYRVRCGEYNGCSMLNAEPGLDPQRVNVAMQDDTITAVLGWG